MRVLYQSTSITCGFLLAAIAAAVSWIAGAR